MTENVRKAYVAGKFYPGSEPEIYSLLKNLREQVNGELLQDLQIKTIVGGILPHAGHIYSGSQTILFFEILRKSKAEIETFVILHPIHRGGSIDYATDDNDKWATPLGTMSIDKEFISTMAIPVDGDIHKWEHSAEVLLPFLQAYNFKQSKIVPVGICWQHPETSKELAQKIDNARIKTKRKICILASTDFSHFLAPAYGAMKDQLALNEILRRDPVSLYKTIRKDNISMCGYGPVMTLLYYVNSLNDDVQMKILSRGHSGMVYPSDSVVDYISIVLYT